MQLFVRGYLNVHTVDVTGFESVEALKNHVCQLEGINEVENQILNLNGSPLIEEEPLTTCGISEVGGETQDNSDLWTCPRILMVTLSIRKRAMLMPCESSKFHVLYS